MDFEQILGDIPAPSHVFQYPETVMLDGLPIPGSVCVIVDDEGVVLSVIVANSRENIEQYIPTFLGKKGLNETHFILEVPGFYIGLIRKEDALSIDALDLQAIVTALADRTAVDSKESEEKNGDKGSN